jgi:cephalosporin hydroxylase
MQQSVARGLVKHLIPQAVVMHVRKRRLRAKLPKPLDIKPLELIRTAPIEKLADAEWLEHEMLPALGLNDEMLGEFPRELYPYCGRGLRHWQYPNQFAPYLASLAGRKITSYLELGVRHGGTFLITLEYLSRFNRMDRAIAVDLIDSPFLAAYSAEKKSSVRFMVLDTQLPQSQNTITNEAPFDLVLIDGDHSEQGCQNDLDLIGPHASIVVLHDIVSSICPGVPAVWKRFREGAADTWKFSEFVDQYDDVLARRGVPYLGIGMAERRDVPTL